MSAGRGHSLSLWSRSNFLLFGAVALTLAVFAGTLAYMVRQPEQQAKAEGPREVFRNFGVALDDRGTVDLSSKSLTISLKLSGLHEDVARRMAVKVTIDGKESQVSMTDGGREAQAAVVLEEKVENLVKSNGIGATLLVKGACEYDGVTVLFDVSALRLRVVSKTEKELTLAFANFPDAPPTPRTRTRVMPTPAETLPAPTVGVPPLLKQAPTPRPTASPTPRLGPTPPGREVSPRELKERGWKVFKREYEKKNSNPNSNRY